MDATQEAHVVASLTPDQLAACRQALLGPDSEALIEWMFQLSLQPGWQGGDARAANVARDLGWIQLSPPALTKLGRLVADPLREYRFWLARDRRVHSEHEHAQLAPLHYRDKAVLEPGCGFGCNLLTLGRLPGRFVGVEPVAVYRQLAPVLAQREGLPAPEVVDGRAEALPFPDATFDIVLCYSMHQYTDIAVALREMARVLRPGGELQLIGGVLWRGDLRLFRNLFASSHLGTLKQDLLTVLNTWSYQWRARRLLVPRGETATTAPIYPAVSHMRRWMQAASLTLREDLTRPVGSEMCFIAEKTR